MIIRRKRNSNFTHISNTVFEAELAVDTLGLLCFLLHLPEDWKVNEKHVTKKFGFGRDRYRRMITELIESGFLIRETVIGKDGKFGGQEIIVYDEPLTGDGFSGGGLPGGSGEPDNILNTNNNNQDLKDNNIKATTVADTDPFFDFLWDNWTDNVKRRGSKKRALTVWKRLSKANQEKAAKLSQNYIERCRKDKQFVKHVSSWLNDKMWLDEEEILEAAE